MGVEAGQIIRFAFRQRRMRALKQNFLPRDIEKSHETQILP